jgi:hypothetical protein
MSDYPVPDCLQGLPPGISQRILESAHTDGQKPSLQYIANTDFWLSRSASIKLAAWLKDRGLSYAGRIPGEKETPEDRDRRLHCEQILWAAFAASPAHNKSNGVLRKDAVPRMSPEAKARAVSALRRTLAMLEDDA